MTRNVGHPGQPGETFAANVGFLIVALVLIGGGPSVRANLLTNPGFETGSFAGWIVASGSASILTRDVHSGTQAARLANAELRQGWLSVALGRAYKAFAWVRIASEVGNDWGGFRVEVVDSNWQTLANSGPLLTETHGTNWFKVALRFTASTPTVMFIAGYFGGGGRAQVVDLDDCALIEDTPGNLPPVVRITVRPLGLDAPATQFYQLDGDDPDGAITQIVWEFGDGVRAFGWQGSRRVGLSGDFTASVYVADDEGLVVTRQVAWSARRLGFPHVIITNPASPEFTTNTPVVVVSGVATGLAAVAVSTDRGFYGLASGSNPWSIPVTLQPGWNRVNVHNAERRIRYVPPGPLAVTGVAESTRTVERCEPLEVTFAITNSAATHPQFPFETNPPPGLSWVDGITVDGLFTPDNWHTIYRRPAFLWQPYARAWKAGEEWMDPTNEPRWCVRFAPPQTGAWQYRIEVREARGSATSLARDFQVVPPPIRGITARSAFRRPTPGILNLPMERRFSAAATGWGSPKKPTRSMPSRPFKPSVPAIRTFSAGGFAGHLWGSAWQPWASRTLAYEGTVPPTGLSVESAYGEGLAAWKLDARNPILFQGFQSGHAGLIRGRSYRVRVRWRTENVTGPAHPAYPFGVCVKFVGWPEPGQTHTLPALIPHVNGDTPWHVATGTFTANSDLLPNLAMILENATGGRAFVDEIAVEESLDGGLYGPNLLRSPRANQHTTFDPRRGAGLEHILRLAQQHGLYFKLVISEKQEYLLNRLSPPGLPDPDGNHFHRGAGSPTRWLHEAYWRHLSARYGVFRSVHSWELVNEAAPGPGEHFELTAAAAQQADRDGNPHLVSISTWAGLATNAWKHAASAPIHYADSHCYVRATGWIEPKEALAGDSARFYHEYDLAAHAADFGNPVVWGEMGLDGTGAGSDDEEPLLANDTSGTWLHKILWARCGPGGVYPLYWWTDNVFRHRLHHLFGNWHRFMEGIPLSNGRYTNAAASSSNPRIRVLGQKDTVARRAHLWLDNADHTWRAVVEGREWSAHTATISVAMGATNARYQLAWVDTTTGRTVSHETRVPDAAGVLAFSVTNLMTDIAVKIERLLTPRERWRWLHFGTPENRGPAADTADPDTDGVPDLLEYALAGNPRTNDAEFLRLTPGFLSAGPTRYLSISYRQNKAATDLRYEPQAGNFLSSGDWSPNGVVEVEREDAGDWWRVTARDSLPLDQVRQRFMRLTIGEP